VILGPAVLDRYVSMLEKTCLVKALSNAATNSLLSSNDLPLSTPITGVAGCCARRAATPQRRQQA